MASPCTRSMNRTSISSLKSFIFKSSKPSTIKSQSFASPSLARRSRFISRPPVELGCFDGCLFSKQSALAMERLKSSLSFKSRRFSSLSQGT